MTSLRNRVHWTLSLHGDLTLADLYEHLKLPSGGDGKLPLVLYDLRQEGLVELIDSKYYRARPQPFRFEFVGQTLELLERITEALEALGRHYGRKDRTGTGARSSEGSAEASQEEATQQGLRTAGQEH